MPTTREYNTARKIHIYAISQKRKRSENGRRWLPYHRHNLLLSEMSADGITKFNTFNEPAEAAMDKNLKDGETEKSHEMRIHILK